MRGKRAQCLSEQQQRALTALLSSPLPLQAKIPTTAGCAPILRTNSMAQPLRKLVRDGPPLMKKFQAARDPYGTISHYSVLGVGYNMYRGFPLSAGLAAFDPGFT